MGCYANLSRPFSDGLSPPFMDEVTVPPRVVGLLAPIGPSAIIGRIGSVVINAVKRFVVWPFAHVCVEVRKALLPSTTDGNSTASVVFKRFRVRVQASVQHGLVKPIQLRMRCAMRDRRLARSVFLQAPARPGSAFQAILADDYCSTAFTATFPMALLILSRSVEILTDHRKASVYASRQVLCSSVHRSIIAPIPTFLHIDVRPETRMAVWRGGRPDADVSRIEGIA